VKKTKSVPRKRRHAPRIQRAASQRGCYTPAAPAEIAARAVTGMSDGISKEEGAANCVDGFKKIIGYAEQKKVTLCLEMLNTRDDSDRMLSLIYEEFCLLEEIAQPGRRRLASKER